MTYLATEILLYLLSAALIGLTLGWMIWGSGQRKKLHGLRNDLMARLEAEREAHKQTRFSLNDAESVKKAAVGEVKAEADRSLMELRQTVEAERQAALEAQTALEKIRAEMDEEIQAGRTSGQEAVDQAMRTANAEKAAAAEAMAKEAQSRAQIEELRLLIGAEKLAAESARNELLHARVTMEAEMKAERAAYVQAKLALDDIRSTLSRTLGPAAAGIVGSAEPAEEQGQPANERIGGDVGRTDSGAGSERGRDVAAPFSMLTDISVAGDALNNPDLDEADIEDREEVSLELSPTIDAEETQELDPASTPDMAEAIEIVDPTPAPSSGRVELRPLPIEPAEPKRPAIFLDQRPDDVDDLQTIDGISPEIERRLHDAGCYRYRQLAELSPKDIDWLARKIDVTAFQIAADNWGDQARSLIKDSDADEGSFFFERTDRENAAG